MERGDIGLEEDKNVNGLYYGTVTFNSPSPKIKKKIADDLFEIYGEKMSESRKSGSHERFFRIKSDTAKQAMTRLENHIRSTAETSGWLPDLRCTCCTHGSGSSFGRLPAGRFSKHFQLCGRVSVYRCRCCTRCRFARADSSLPAVGSIRRNASVSGSKSSGRVSVSTKWQ